MNKQKQRVKHTNINLLEKMIGILQALLANKDNIQKVLPHPSKGLCTNLTGPCFGTPPYLKLLFESWKHYSGIDSYPIPTPDDKIPHDFYFSHLRAKTLYTGDYGKMRFKLAKYLLKKMKKDLEYLKVKKENEQTSS